MNKHIFLKTNFLAAALVFGTTCGTVAIAQAQSIPADPPAGSSFDQRLDQRKKEQQVQLSKQDQQRLTQQCVAAQTKIRQLQPKTTAVVNMRTNVYRNISGRQWVAVGELKLANEDTFNFEKQLTEYTNKVSAFRSTATTYQQTLDDLTLINCQADVVGFEALLQTARYYYAQLQSQSQDIRNYVINTIKPTLTDFASRLQPAEATQGGQ